MAAPSIAAWGTPAVLGSAHWDPDKGNNIYDVALTDPAGTTAGSLVVAEFHVLWYWDGTSAGPDASNISLPAGWSLGPISTFIDNVDTLYGGVFWAYKYATGGPSTDTFSFYPTATGAVSEFGAGISMLVADGPTTGNPFVDTMQAAYTEVHVSSVGLASFTPSGDDSLLLGAWMLLWNDSGMSFTEPAGWTHSPSGSWYTDGQLNFAFSSLRQTTAAATGPLTWTTGSGVDGQSIVVVTIRGDNDDTPPPDPTARQRWTGSAWSGLSGRKRYDGAIWRDITGYQLAAAYLTATITTDGPIVDKVNYVNASIDMSYLAGGSAYNTATATMKGRGNSTWSQPKKPYKVKLASSQSVFGLPASKNWALLANYLDQSALRTAVSYELSRRATGRWSPHSQYAELTLNGSAAGLYQFIETADVQPGRLDIRKMKDTDTSGLALTGPYFLEIDYYMADGEGFRTSRSTPVSYDTPDVAGVSAQETYIQSYIEAFETTIVSGGDAFLDQIDLPSWVDWYILNELTANNDSPWVTSCKLYKDQDTADAVGKLFLGPPWDFDLSLGNAADYGSGYNFWVTQTQSSHDRSWPNWIYYAMQNPTFQRAVYSRWASAWVPAISGIYAYIDTLSSGLTPAITHDRAIWFGASGLPSQHTAAWIKNWLSQRTQWLTANLPNPAP